MEVAVQAYTFAAMVLTGALLGLFFDCYRVAGRLLRLRGRVTAVLDLIYWLGATCIALVSACSVQLVRASHVYIPGFSWGCCELLPLAQPVCSGAAVPTGSLGRKAACVVIQGTLVHGGSAIWFGNTAPAFTSGESQEACVKCLAQSKTVADFAEKAALMKFIITQ